MKRGNSQRNGRMGKKNRKGAEEDGPRKDEGTVEDKRDEKRGA